MHTAQRTLTLTALALLVFTGCGEQKTGSIPEPSDSNPTSSAASASGSVSTTATAQETEHYSGGSKAPDGEYRAADEFGPAQNVPKPVKPEVLNVESEEGLQNFIWYWTDSVNYGIQTGDFSIAGSLTSENFKEDFEFYAWGEELYKRGGWIVGGRREAILGENLMVSQGNGQYTWAGQLTVENIQPFLDEPGIIVDHSSTAGQAIYFETEFKNGKWIMLNVVPIEGAN